MVCRELAPRICTLLKRGAKLAFLALLTTSLAARGVVAPCCQPHADKTPSSNDCFHHMVHMQACGAWQAASSHADCSCVSDATEPASSPVFSSECSSNVATANGNTTAEMTLAITLPQPSPEKPPPLQAVCRQALSCTFLI